jgi:predicted enzyme related to lactoylglutathione lyase
MAKIVGLGGAFIRAQNAEALRRWYVEVLGIEIDGENGATFHPHSEDAIVAFSIFAKDSTYIGDPTRQMAMLNFVVDDLEGFVTHLQAVGVHAEPIQAESYGKFTWLTDPESNRIELWEPVEP